MVAKVIKVPGMVSFGCHEYEILFDESQEDGEFRGTYLSRRHKILLNPSLHPQQLRITYLHELVHLICDLNHLDPTERDITRLAESFGELLFRNFGVEFDFSEVGTLVREKKE